MPVYCTILNSNNHLPASHSTFQLLQGVLCGIAAAVWEAHPHSFNSTCHGVGCVHAATGTSPGAGIPVDVEPLGLVNQIGCIGTCSKKLVYRAKPASELDEQTKR